VSGTPGEHPTDDTRNHTRNHTQDHARKHAEARGTRVAVPVAARIGLALGLDSEWGEEARESPAATGERGGAQGTGARAGRTHASRPGLLFRLAPQPAASSTKTGISREVFFW
jgi:hypothetical protein